MSDATMVNECLSMDTGWRFHLGDIPFPKLISHSECYDGTKAGYAGGAANPGFDDTEWPVINVPHDWASESPFVAGERLSQGYRPRGIGWYRKRFRLDPADRGRHLELQFDGVATHCTVWVNGILIHRNWCGYTGWNIDLTPVAKYGDELNCVAIRVDAEAMEGWWYEGAGIYRHTRLVKRNPVHIVTDGVWADPVRAPDGAWSLPVEVTLENSGSTDACIETEVTVLDPAGRGVGRATVSATVAVLDQAVVNVSIPVSMPRLWSVDEPTLYQVQTIVKHDGKIVDKRMIRCGFRTIRFDADHGFFLNDQPLKLQGVCNHQDHAGVGVAIPDALWAFRLRRLKEMGANAYRCSHHPPARELLDLCDQLGILVMDENRHFNSSLETLRQLEWLVRRDRNHPSVILWSVFNEEPMQGDEIGYEMVRRMAAIVRRLDPTRPVTAAMNGGLFAPINVSQAVDVVGFNYHPEYYDRFHATHPGLPLTSSEDTSAVMTRGEYANHSEQHILESYDTQHPFWGITHRGAWRAIHERAYLAGGFIWTGFDYHGEPTPHVWPSCSSFFGCMDLCGFPKAAFHMRRAHWVKSEPVLELIPHWNWPGREGRPVKVMAISNAARVALNLNGVFLGEKAVDPYDFATWESVAYRPGHLEVIAYDAAGNEVSRTAVETTGEAVALELVPDRTVMDGDGDDAQPITVLALDAQGRAVPTANMAVEFELTGPGAIIGLGNGDPNCHEPEKGNRRSLFNGLAQVIVQTTPGSIGELVLRAHASGLHSAAVGIKVQKAPARPAIPSEEPILFVQSFRMSPPSRDRQDPTVKVADNDMNTWQVVFPGAAQDFGGGTWAVYRGTFLPYACVMKSGGTLRFKSILGRAEIWIDGALFFRKEAYEDSPLTVALPPGEGLRILSVLLETEPGKPAGILGAVSVVSLETSSMGQGHSGRAAEDSLVDRKSYRHSLKRLFKAIK